VAALLPFREAVVRDLIGPRLLAAFLLFLFASFVAVGANAQEAAQPAQVLTGLSLMRRGSLIRQSGSNSPRSSRILKQSHPIRWSW